MRVTENNPPISGKITSPSCTIRTDQRILEPRFINGCRGIAIHDHGTSNSNYTSLRYLTNLGRAKRILTKRGGMDGVRRLENEPQIWIPFHIDDGVSLIPTYTLNGSIQANIRNISTSCV